MNDGALIFPGVSRPSSDFPAVRSELRAPPTYRDIDLSTARSVAAGNAAVLPLAGNLLYIDQKASSGFATLRLSDDANSAPVTVYPGFLCRAPFTCVLLENVAQPGMVLRVIYGTDLDFSPVPSAAGVTVLNALSISDLVAPGCQYLPASLPVAVGANQVTLVYGTALNPRGLNVRSCLLTMTGAAGGSYGSALIAAASAPVTFAVARNQAICLGVVNVVGAVTDQSRNDYVNRRLPAGWGIWNICTNNVAVAASHGVHLSLEAA